MPWWSGWSVGNEVGPERSVVTAAPTSSASATVSAHAASLALVRPSSSSGRSASTRSLAARSTASGSGAGAVAGTTFVRSGMAMGAARRSSCSPWSRQT